MSSSTEHKKLAERCGGWINGRTTARGKRGGYEVPLAPSYVADYVCLCWFQDRIRRHYIEDCELERVGCALVTPELACVFEVKVSRCDYAAKFSRTNWSTGNRKVPVGGLHWIVTPHGMVVPKEVPSFWGLLWACGGGLHEVQQPRFCTAANVESVAYNLVWYGKDLPG